MKILVCGGRDFIAKERLFSVLDGIDIGGRIDSVVHGASRGADTLAGEWARSRGRIEIPVPADWDKWGRSAGPRRNEQMLAENPDISLVVAFLGGRGTADMVFKASEAGLSVLEVK